jgi:endonuclease-3
MTRRERAERIAAILDQIYPELAIPLRHEDPFTLLVAVLLSAQTTDKKVNEVTPALFARASTPAQMARLPVSEVHRHIRSIGLANTKAKNLKRLSRLLVERHAGEVPRSLAELEALPGVGHKTASVVMVQAWGEPAFPVDTHIHRLAHRWGLSSGKNVRETERDLKALFPEESWAKLHLQIIYFGREHCPALYHDFEGCPICSWAAPAARRVAERSRRRRASKRAPSGP